MAKKNLQPIGLPELVKKLGAPTIAAELGCDRGLPNKWARGQRPGWSNADALVALAKRKGYALTIAAGGAK